MDQSHSGESVRFINGGKDTKQKQQRPTAEAAEGAAVPTASYAIKASEEEQQATTAAETAAGTGLSPLSQQHLINRVTLPVCLTMHLSGTIFRDSLHEEDGKSDS